MLSTAWNKLPFRFLLVLTKSLPTTMDLAERNESFQTTVPQREKEKRKNPTLPHILTGNFLGHFLKHTWRATFLKKKSHLRLSTKLFMIYYKDFEGNFWMMIDDNFLQQMEVWNIGEAGASSLSILLRYKVTENQFAITVCSSTTLKVIKLKPTFSLQSCIGWRKSL